MTNKAPTVNLKAVAFLAALMVTAMSPALASSKVESKAVPRILFVDYQEDEVIMLRTAMGIVTRVVLASDEKISRPADSGFPSDCSNTALEWCIRADVGDNQITVKPRPGATRNNLEVSTDKRDYSFLFLTSRGAENASDVSFRVVVRHPMPPPPVAHVALPEAQPSSTAATEPKAPPTPTLVTPPVRNFHYSMRHDEPGKEIVPSVIFDDGRFTYMKFERAREIPAVFAVDGSGNEMRVSFHSQRLLADPHEPHSTVEADYMVIRRLSKVWRLRLGSAVAEITNDDFDGIGIETHNGTTVPGITREVKE